VIWSCSSGWRATIRTHWHPEYPLIDELDVLRGPG